jgi:hypothetical protein
VSLFVLSIVLFAAFLHALWNAIVKGAGDKTIMLGLIAVGHVGPGIVMVAIAPAPVIAALRCALFGRRRCRSADVGQSTGLYWLATCC